MNSIKSFKDFLVRLVGGVENLVDAVASLPPGELKTEVGLIVTAVTTFGIFQVANPGSTVDALTALIIGLAAVGVALERVVKAVKG